MTKRDVFIEKDVMMWALRLGATAGLAELSCLYRCMLMWLDNFNGSIPAPAIMVPNKSKTGSCVQCSAGIIDMYAGSCVGGLAMLLGTDPCGRESRCSRLFFPR